MTRCFNAENKHGGRNFETVKHVLALVSTGNKKHDGEHMHLKTNYQLLDSQGCSYQH